MKGKFHKALILLITVALLTVTFGLAVPSITVAVQDLGSGSGELFSPVSTGTVCAPYALYFYAFGSWYGPYYLEDITEVYPGNFTKELPSGTNISATVYLGSTLVSSGMLTLNSELPPGYYTVVQIDPPIDYAHVLNGEFRVTVQSPEYTTSSSGRISLSLQELGNGLPTGYRDYLVLYDDFGWYQVYVVLRCYRLSFVPEAVLGGGFVTVIPTIISEQDMSIDKGTSPLSPLPSGYQRKCQDLKHLWLVIRESPYLRKAVYKAVHEMEQKLIEAQDQS